MDLLDDLLESSEVMPPPSEDEFENLDIPKSLVPFNKVIFVAVLEGIYEGQTLSEVCCALGVDITVINKWSSLNGEVALALNKASQVRTQVLMDNNYKNNILPLSKPTPEHLTGDELHDEGMKTTIRTKKAKAIVDFAKVSHPEIYNDDGANVIVPININIQGGGSPQKMFDTFTNVVDADGTVSVETDSLTQLEG